MSNLAILGGEKAIQTASSIRATLTAGMTE